MARLGIYGGTFDPPHVGHLILACEALEQLHLDRLLWVLTADPPHKQGRTISPVADRLDLLQAALAGNEEFVLSRVDIDRPPPHFAVDTVRLLREAHPGAVLAYVMGGDSLRDLPTWHDPASFVNAVDEIGVMRRPGDEVDPAALERALPGVMDKVRWIRAPLIEISAYDIRLRAKQGRSFRYYLLPGVYEVVVEKGLYRETA